MGALIVFVALATVIVVAIEWRERKKQKHDTGKPKPEAAPRNVRPEGCCGEHLVCEKETLLITKPEIVYYDDEELDQLAGINPEDYTDAQRELISSVFYTLQETDVAGWCRSLQMRNIGLPEDIREQALMIVREMRAK
ncbi:MAG: phospholipase [Paludibacteraceae bacterium]|nr:phospholipase [Paludibacteraceae bacterium]